MFDVTDYGATGDGTTDDRQSIQDAIDAAGASGGVVFFPKGTYLLASEFSTASGDCLRVPDNWVTLEGLGRGLSILKLDPQINASIINFEGASETAEPGVVGGCVRKLEIAGNYTNQTGDGGHGIRVGSSNLYFQVQDVYIHDIKSYGIGLQRGTTKDCVIENVLIEDTGADGIDIKNANDNNSNNKMVNITVRRAGKRSDLAGQACIDIRGPWNLTNIFCSDFNSTNCQTGIRFRPGESTDEAGTGGHRSTLTNFYVETNDGSGTYGVHIAACHVSVVGGQVSGTEVGVLVSQQEATVTGVIAKGCGTGFQTEDSSEVSNGDRATFVGCIARGCSDSGFKIITDECVLDGIIARSNVHGVNLRTGSAKTTISGQSSSNSGNNIHLQAGGITWKDGGVYY